MKHMETVQEAIRQLTRRCDRAVSRDGVGFNKLDAEAGHRLADTADWTRDDYLTAYRILHHYPKQLEDLGITLPSLEELKEALNAIFPHRPVTSRTSDQQRPLITVENGTLWFYSRYEDRVRLKELFPKASWDANRRAWKLPEVRLNTREAFEALFHEFPSTDEARKALEEKVASFRQFQDQLKTAQQLKTGELGEIQLPTKAKPFEHQVRAFALARTLDNSALLMEQGTGKTLVAIAVAGDRYLKGEIQRLLVVCPSSVLYEWKRQFEELAGFPYVLHILEGSIRERAEFLRQMNSQDVEGLLVVAVNYEATWRLEEELKGWQPDMIILDESQKIKRFQAQQTKACIRIGRDARYRMILTGTPVTQSPLDYFTQYRFLDDRIFGRSFRQFRDRYAIMGGYGGYQVIDYKNLEELAEKVGQIAFRVRKDECLDLPDTLDQFRYVQLEPEARALYHEMLEKAIIRFSEEEQVTAPIVLTELLRLQQITGGFLPVGDEVRQVSKAKLEALKDILEDLKDAGKQVVVFARFRPEVKAIAKVARELGLTTFTLTGETSTEARGRGIRDFQEGRIQVFVAQIATGGLGITLTAADTAIFYSADFSLANYDQAKARLHRIGQRRPVTYIHLIVKGSIDEEVIKRLAKKQDLARLVVDELRKILEGGDTMKKPYEGLQPGTEAWMACWRRYPELQDEMLEYQRRLKGEDDDMEHKKASKVVELEQQVEQAVEEIERILEDEDFEKIITPAVEAEEVIDKEESKKTSKQLRLFPFDRIVTVKDLADELGTQPKTLRKWLRKNAKKVSGRWEWEADSPELDEIRAKYHEEYGG